ncbi:histidine phosphatase family protein [Nocardioides aequoreus]|uniref:histidine phosphatase family protein n=1 Tax=Nocardioides aequoreus TaxID=397278 RepID=UPI0004C2DCEC|nr:histidine phosphatase family protein [Nocardioides aequoreus]
MVDPSPGQGRRLVVLRHGRTAWNAEGRAQGHEDIGLDDQGREQAERTAEVLAAYEPSVLVCSDLARARQTAALLEKATGLTAVEDPRLREYDTGARTGLTAAEYAERAGTAYEPPDGHTLLDVPGAERVEEVAERIGPALREAVDRLAPGETGVVVTHGAAMRVGLTRLLDLPGEAYAAFGSIRNCGWVEVTERGGRLRLTAYDVVVPA